MDDVCTAIYGDITMKIIKILIFTILLSSCTLFDSPEGFVELSENSIHTRTELQGEKEEVVYCCANAKITNTGDKTIYTCTITAVAKSDADIDHYVSLSYDVTIPPSQSIYVTIEWSLVRQIEITNTTTTNGSTSGSSSGTSTSSTATTTTSTRISDANLEKNWKTDSLKIVDYFFD